MKRIFLDANVLFSAAISSKGRAAALVALTRRGVCTLLTSSHAVTEARRNLEARYPKALGRFDRLLHAASIAPEAARSTVEWARSQGLPEEDAPILAAAISAGADALVTGDRTHFGHLFGRTIRNVRVLRLVDALDLLVK